MVLVAQVIIFLDNYYYAFVLDQQVYVLKLLVGLLMAKGASISECLPLLYADYNVS